MIREAAHAYARADRAMICWTLGITEHHNAVDNVLSLINLALLTGHVGRYGSGLNPLRGQNNVQGGGDMGAIPNKLPGLPGHRARRRGARAVRGGLGRADPPALRLAPDADVRRHGARRAAHALRDRREPGAVRGRRPSRARKLLDGLDFLVVQDIFMTQTAELADVVLPGTASWCEAEGTVTNSERRVQRVRKALDPPGDARDDMLDHRASSRGGSATTGASPRAEEVWDELRSLSPMHRGMSYERLEELGGIQWPCPDEEHPGSPFLHGRLWAGAASRARAAPFCPSSTGRRSRRSTPSSRSASRPAGGSSPTTPACRRTATARRCTAASRSTSRPRTPSGSSLEDGEIVRVSSRRGSVEAPVRIDPALRPGLAFMTLPLPGRGRHERADDRRDRPEVGHGRVQGLRGPRREARSRRRRGGRAAAAPRGRADASLARMTRGPPPARRASRRSASAPRVDACSARPRRGWDGGSAPRGRRRPRRARRARGAGRRHLLLPALSGAGARRLDQPRRAQLRLPAADVPPADAYGVATFYALLSLEPRPPRVVHVCDDIACRCRGSSELIAELEERFGAEGELSGRRLGDLVPQPVPRPVRPGAGRAVSTWPASEPLEHVLAAGQRRPTSLAALDGGDARRPRPRRRVPQTGDPALRLLRRVGAVDPTSLDDYRAHGGYAALRRAFELGPEGVIREVNDSSCWAAAAPRSRPGASGTPSRASRRGRTTSSATPTSPSRARSRIACSWRATRSRSSRR